MSKPNKPGELRDVNVEAISLVSKAANGEKFKIFKSTDAENETVSELYDAKSKAQQLWQAIDSLLQVIGFDRWGDTTANKNLSAEQIRNALEDFKTITESILITSNETIKKTVTELQKSGRKISNSRLTKLKDIQAMLNDVLSDIDNDGNTTDVAKKAITDIVTEAVKPLSERIENIEKIDAEAQIEAEKAAQAQQAEETRTKAEGIIKSAIQESIQPLIARLERVEKARGISNKVPEDTVLAKDNNEFWGRIF